MEVLFHSYANFLQTNIPPKERKKVGLQRVFSSIFPLHSLGEEASLEFVSYHLEPPLFSTEECLNSDLTYDAKLRVTFRLNVFEVNKETETKSFVDIKEQSVYMGNIPLMTDKASFIINGTERVVVNQMHKSPGAFFSKEEKAHSPGKITYIGRIIPYRGTWLDFEIDNQIYVRIDRQKKISALLFLKALGMSDREILSTFYTPIIYQKKNPQVWCHGLELPHLVGNILSYDLLNPNSGEVIVKKGKKIEKKHFKVLEKEGIKQVGVRTESLIGMPVSQEVTDASGKVLVEIGTALDSKMLEEITQSGIKKLALLQIDTTTGQAPYESWVAHKIKGCEEALQMVYNHLYPGEYSPTKTITAKTLENLLFNPDIYNLSEVGRIKLNNRLGIEAPEDQLVLNLEDILAVLKYLTKLSTGKGDVDDIDHLGNRRVRSVGEVLENQYRQSLARMEKGIVEKMSSADVKTLMPAQLIGAKLCVAVVKEFFGSSQLSQLMDQSNPLSEITHKRRLSTLGPGGLNRERAGFEVRDVHATHYGRICPIETPEGANIGLINSLSTYARVNRYGFIETPYYKVENGQVTREVVHLSAVDEEGLVIASSRVMKEASGKMGEAPLQCRKDGEFIMASPQEIDLIDVSPQQLVSIASSLIPFLEHDDANRALMGANMQRQAVPLMKTAAPFVGTGMEEIVARESGAMLIARRSGIVEQVDNQRIVIRTTEEKDFSKSGVDIYQLKKMGKTNQNTCFSQVPLVSIYNAVKEGDVIADGPATDNGELSLGKNVLVCFLSWQGYNFEDSVIISERLVKDDIFTSIHIEEFNVSAHDTKLGQEEITQDVPNVGEETLRHLDECGIAEIGAEVQEGDVLVGKITPKGELLITPEEKLLRAIFGEKAANVKDTSLRLPPGSQGTVVNVRIFNQKDSPMEKDARSRTIEQAEIDQVRRNIQDERLIYERNIYTRLKEFLKNQKLSASNRALKGLKKGQVLTSEVLHNLNKENLWKISVTDREVMNKLEALHKQHQNVLKQMEESLNQLDEKIKMGNDPPSGVLKTVNVYVAIKRKIQPGDKVAGRHGNKGVISRIVPEEDMPYLADGTPIDMILNPLGIPSRMNIGQVLETHLGLAARGLGMKIDKLCKELRKQKKPLKPVKTLLSTLHTGEEQEYIQSLNDKELEKVCKNLDEGVCIASPVFNGVKEEKITELLELGGYPPSGQIPLYDGRTGKPFDGHVTVGSMYMMKLHHLVDDKIHARSIGPYSLVTQQPLGGKSQFGGQRFGEMEVWALEAYGAAYTLREMLTVKSDDIRGRGRMYEAIIGGSVNFSIGIPESFNVLIKELRGLGLNLELKTSHLAPAALPPPL